jgi:hypothetical protein
MPDTVRFSPCHGAEIYASLADGVLIGTCSSCGTAVIRMNPQSGQAEWLDGRSPWADVHEYDEAAP